MGLGWLKKIAGPAKEIGKVAGQAALQSAVATNPILGVALTIAQAASQHNGVTGETITVLNAILVPAGFMVIALPQTTPSHSP